FLLVCVTLKPFGIYSATNFSVPVLIALLVCLIPTTIGGLLSAIGIAGMDRVLQRNVLAMSGRAVEAAGDVDVLLLDKTGTITLGNRMAVGFHPAPGVSPDDLAASAQLSSLADETPEGRSIVVLAKEKFGLRARDMHELEATFVPFTAQTRMSGVDLHANGAEPKMRIRKGAADAVRGFVELAGGIFPQPVTKTVHEISHRGGTPLVVASDMLTLGTIELKDVVKGGIKERFAQLRKMGIKTVMITGDNPLTAAAIAAEAGVDDFMAQATPEQKLQRIRQEQFEGHLVAMTGDGTNDAPALAQADVGVAMNTGTQAAREAGNMVDLDSNPTKLLDIVEIGKQMLITRGSLTTFSIANDVAKYFAIIPAMLMGTFPAIAPHARTTGDRASVTAALANYRRGFPGDRCLVNASDSLDDIAVCRNNVAGFAYNEIAFLQSRSGNLLLASVPQTACDRILARPPQAGGLRFATAFRHRFSKIGKEHREPEPDRQLRHEASQARVSGKNSDRR
ncbi:MAG: K(+)-transporting ATPase subunit B, partial [Acidobacteria bacterium]